MAFKEKSAWLQLAGMVLAYGAYFVALGQLKPQSALPMLALFAAATAVRLVILGVGYLVLALRAGGDARAPADERDRSIARRGAATAYYVLMAGMLLVGMVMPFYENGLTIVNAALAAIVVAEIVSYATIIASYRRGWHG